ncbi:tetratricopeptide repeat protein [Candidatus Omnitrophota bacterium]
MRLLCQQRRTIKLPRDNRRPKFIITALALSFILYPSFFSVAEEAAAPKENLTKEIEQLDFANGLFERELYGMAISEFKNFIKLYAASESLHRARFGIAESLFFLKKYDEAITAYEDYIKEFSSGENINMSNLRIAQIFSEKKEFDKALEHFKAIKEDTLDADYKQMLFFYKAKTYNSMDDNDRAIVFFEKAAGVKPGGQYTVYSFIEIGDIHFERSDYRRAVEYYTRAYKDSGASAEHKYVSLYKKGEVQFKDADFKDSAKTFTQLLAEYPDRNLSKDALVNLLLSYFNMSRYDDVILVFDKNKKLLEENGLFFEPYYIVASSYSERSRYKDALSALDKILTFASLKNEDRHRALLKKTKVLLRSNRFSEMIALADNEFKDSKDDLDYIAFLRAEAYYGLQDYEKAYMFYEKIRTDFLKSDLYDTALYSMAYAKYSLNKNNEALSLFIRYFKEGKDSKKRQESLFKALLIEVESGLLEDAIRHSNTFISTFKGNPLNENILFQLGSLYSKQKDYQEASRVFRQFIQDYDASPRHLEARFLLAYNLQLLGKQDEALGYYAKILTESNQGKLYYPALKNTALIYLDKEDDKKAAEILDRIITEFQENDLDIDSYIWLAKHYIDTKRFKDALKVLQRSESNKGFKERSKEIAYFKAESYRETSNFEDAIRHYDIVLSEEGDSAGIKAPSHIGKGLSLVEMKDFDKARLEFDKALLEEPDNNTVTMKARFEIANIEDLKNNLDEAARLYMLVAVLYSNDHYCPKALFRAGRIFEELNRKDEALKAYGEIVNSYKKSHLYEDTKKRIKILRED